MKKALISLLLAVTLIASLSFGVFALVEPSDEFYVTDDAGVLSSSTEKSIIETNGELEYYCSGAQFVVVTVDYSDGLYSDEYANKLFYDWGVGDDNEDNGMLLLLIVKEGKGWLATGDGIDNVFTDKMADDFLNEYFWDDFDAGQYDRAVTTLMGNIVGWYYDFYNVSTGGAYYEPSGGGAYYEPSGGNVSFGSFIISFLVRNLFTIILIILVLRLIIRSDRTRYYDYYAYTGLIPPRRYRFWFILMPSPHRSWNPPHTYNHYNSHVIHNNPPKPGSTHHSSGFGGFSGGSSHSSGGFGSGSHSSGGFGGGHSGSGFGGGGRSGGGGGGRR